MISRGLACVLLLVVLMSGCARQETSASGAALVTDRNSKAAYDSADCPFDVPQGFQVNINCGFLTVPEVRQDQTGVNQPVAKTVKMSVAVLKSTTQGEKLDPVLFMMTNPSSEMDWAWALSYFFPDLYANRDLIAVDVRGVGHAQPTFDCPEERDLQLNLLDLNPFSDEVILQTVAAQQTCFQRWQNEGINLQAYSTEAIVADLEELRIALGYKQWSVYGAGYGATLAYGMLRDYSKSLRSVVLDGVEPVDVDDFLGQGANYQRVLNHFFQACAGDAQCSQAYPDLEPIFYRLVDDLNASPKVLEVPDLQSGARRQVYLNGDQLMENYVLAYAIHNMHLVAQLPRVAYQANKGNFEGIISILSEMFPFVGQQGQGLVNLLNCSEVIPNLPQAGRWQALQDLNVQWSAYFEKVAQGQDEICKTYEGVKMQPRLFGPPESSVPTLVLYSQINPWSSPEWAKKAASKLSRVQLVELKSVGSSAWLDGQTNCGRQLGTAFLQDPEGALDTQCASQPPKVSWVTLQ